MLKIDWGMSILGKTNSLKGQKDMQSKNVVFWYKEHPTDKIYWEFDSDRRGDRVFSFDKKTVFHLFEDYPFKLTREQKQIFDEENPFWANFFADRE